jgi:phosphoglycerate kinase
MSHLGRPEGTPDPQYSLAPVAARLSELLGEDVAFGEPGDSRVTLLENLRFDPRETSKDAGERQVFADELATLGDVVVSDGFGAVHRAHASVYELPQTLPSAAGQLITTGSRTIRRSLTPWCSAARRSATSSA